MVLEEMNKLSIYRGKSIEKLTREELIIALNEMATYYEARLANKDKIINLYKKR